MPEDNETSEIIPLHSNKDAPSTEITTVSGSDPDVQRRRKHALRWHKVGKNRQVSPPPHEEHVHAFLDLDRQLQIRKGLTKENAHFILEEQGIIDSLQAAVLAYNEENPTKKAFWDVGYMRVDDKTHPVGVIRWDEEERDISKLKEVKLLAKAVRVVGSTVNTVSPDFDTPEVSYTVEEQEVDEGLFSPSKPRPTVVWHPLVISKMAEGLPLDKKLRLAMDRSNGKMFYERILSDGPLGRGVSK